MSYLSVVTAASQAAMALLYIRAESAFSLAPGMVLLMAFSASLEYC